MGSPEGSPLPKFITLVRHGQSEANRASVWQGVGSSPLTDLGRSQAVAAGERLRRRRFDRVVSSDLERAADTARLAGFEPDERTIWREGDLGAWEGMTFAEVWERFRDELERLHRGEDVALGGTGESPATVAGRARQAVDELLDELDDGEAALVVTHGGLINGLVRRILGVPPGGRRVGIPANTSLCEIVFEEGTARLVRFNDAHHLGPSTHWTREHLRNGHPVIELIRHAQTEGNVTGRMQGHADWGLNETGRAQAAALARWLEDVDAVYASPLGRAHETSEIVFPERARLVDALKEIDLGTWNGQKWAELPRDETFHELFVENRDLRRGAHGETWEELRHRVTGFVERVSPDHGGQRVAMVSHGGSIKAFIGGALGLDYAGSRTLLGGVENTSISQVVMLPDGPMVSSYNVAGHLEHNRVEPASTHSAWGGSGER